MEEKEVQHILIEILYATLNKLENNETIKESANSEDNKINEG